MGQTYQEFFNKKLEQYNVKSPAQLDKDGKKKFFNEIELEWTADDKPLNEQTKKYQEFFKQKMQKFGVKSPAELNKDEKKEFFDEIDSEWTSQQSNKSLNESALTDLGKLTIVYDGTKAVSKFIRIPSNKATDTYIDSLFNQFSSLGNLYVMIFNMVGEETYFYYHEKGSVLGWFSNFEEINLTPQLMVLHTDTSAIDKHDIFEELLLIKNNPELYNILPVRNLLDIKELFRFLSSIEIILPENLNDRIFVSTNEFENILINNQLKFAIKAFGMEIVNDIIDSVTTKDLEAYANLNGIDGIFKQILSSYYGIIYNWDSELNNEYPFDHSFNEIEFPEWCFQFLPNNYKHQKLSLDVALVKFKTAFIQLFDYITKNSDGNGLIDLFSINVPVPDLIRKLNLNYVNIESWVNSYFINIMSTEFTYNDFEIIESIFGKFNYDDFKNTEKKDELEQVLTGYMVKSRRGLVDINEIENSIPNAIDTYLKFKAIKAGIIDM